MSRAKVDYQDRPDLAEAVKRRAANLRRLRGERSLTATALALAAEDMAPSYIYEIENGRVALSSLRILDSRFGLVRGQAPIDLTSAGVRCAGRIAKAMDAQQRRELRQLDAREAVAEAEPA